MNKRSLKIVLLLLYTVVVFGGAYALGYNAWPLTELGVPSSTMPAEAEEVFDPFWEVWNLVNEQYFDQPVDPETLTEGAIEGMLATLDDPHSRYLSPSMEESARQSMEGELQGIGVLVEMVDGQITVVSPFEGSPADEAGLQPGDVLLEAAGTDLRELGLNEAAELIRGPAGTTIRLLIQRDQEQFEVEIERDVIEIPSVRGEMLESDVAYVRLSRFANPTPEQLRSTLEELLAQEPRGLVLDLRNNPGGGLNTAVDVADEFLDEGVVLTERFGSGQERVFRSEEGGVAQEIPMAVLINEGSASASEVLAGAIRDRERGTLVGQTTFGKGTVQTWHALSNGGGVRITTARWLTPGGHWVNEGGITPDVVVSMPETFPGESAEDPQLEAAVDLLLAQENGPTPEEAVEE
jgi:carboxyl-terminal processing protease